MLTPDLQQLTDVRPQLEQSLMAQAWTVAGDVLWAIERRNFDDLASSWRRLCRLRGVDFPGELLVDVYDSPRWYWAQLPEAISAALRNAEALDWLRHWKAANRAVQAVLVAQAEHCGDIATGHIAADIQSGYEIGAVAARKAAHYARLALGGGQ